MLGTVVNAVLILAGSFLGICFQSRIGARFSTILTHALGLCVMAIGVTSITLASALGVGVACSALPLALYQGGSPSSSPWRGPCWTRPPSPR